MLLKHSDYNKEEATAFCEKYGVRVNAELVGYKKYFADDKETRPVYKITLHRNNRQYTYTFGDSIYNMQHDKKPTIYDVLACLQKFEVGTFSDFCSEFGYNDDGRKAEKIYKLVVKEYENMTRLFNDAELLEMDEIFC